MSSPAVHCYWLEPTGRARLALRRFTFAVREGKQGARGYKDCPARPSGCDATADLTEFIRVRFEPSEHGKTLCMVPRSRRPLVRDTRWPDVCVYCGESLPKTAMRQVNQALEYERGDDGSLVYMRAYPGPDLAGALYDGWWRPDEPGSDGIFLVAVCPNGMAWNVDGEATGGGYWTRTGDPRRPETLSVTPSIQAGSPSSPSSYHGFLTAGRFTPG